MLPQPGHQPVSHPSRSQTDLLADLILLSNFTHPSRARLRYSEKPEEACRLLVWGLEECVVALFIGCSSLHIISCFSVGLSRSPFVSWWDSCFIYTLFLLCDEMQGLHMEVVHLYSLMKIGGNFTSFITCSWQSLSSAAEQEKVKITTLGKCVVHLIYFFTLR